MSKESESRFRQKDFHMHLFPEEYDMLEQKASAAGMSKTDFLREFIANGKVINRKEFSETIQKMYAILTDIDYRLRGEIYQEERCDDGAVASAEFVRLKDQVEALTSLYAEAFLDFEDEA